MVNIAPAMTEFDDLRAGPGKSRIRLDVMKAIRPEMDSTHGYHSLETIALMSDATRSITHVE